MDFNKLYTYVVGNEIKDYNLVNGRQTAKKVANLAQNPNAIYRVASIENPSGLPMYNLVNVSQKNDVIDMNFKTIQDAQIYALSNKLQMEKDTPAKKAPAKKGKKVNESKQDDSILKLQKKGFEYKSQLDGGDIMMVQSKGGSHQVVQVDDDGNCNGMPFDKYVKEQL